MEEMKKIDYDKRASDMLASGEGRVIRDQIDRLSATQAAALARLRRTRNAKKDWSKLISNARMSFGSHKCPKPGTEGAEIGAFWGPTLATARVESYAYCSTW